MQSSRSREKGFSLVEMSVAMATFLIVLAGIAPLMTVGQRSARVQDANTEAIANARFAMDRISELIRNSGYDPRGTGIAGATIGSQGDSITLRSDLNGDGDTDDGLSSLGEVAAPESVTLSLLGNQIMLMDWTAPYPVMAAIAGNVQALHFTQPSADVISVTVTAYGGVVSGGVALPTDAGTRSVTLTQTLYLRNVF